MRARSRVFGIVALAYVFAAGACGNDPVVANIEHGPRANGAIVFAASPLPDYGPVQLFSMRGDGTQLRQLTDDLNYKTAVATSPDGARIAYAAFDEELTEESPSPEPSSIFVMQADGSGREELCDACARTAYAYGPEIGGFEPWFDGTFFAVPNSLAWSPAGSTIAVPAVTPGVLLIDVATGEQTTIATPEPVTAIAWAPDGKRLALSHTWFSAQQRTSLGLKVPSEGTELEREPVELPGGIYVFELESEQLEQAVVSPGLAHVHGWSSGGDRIALTHLVDSKRTGISVYSVSEDRMWAVVPGDRGAAPLGVGWSPSDDALAALVDQYDEQVQQAKDFWMTPSTEVDIRTLPICDFEGAFDGDQCAKATIAWSPDGTTVAYRAMLHGTPVRSAVILQGADDSFTKVVLVDEASFDIGEGPCCLAWLPAA